MVLIDQHQVKISLMLKSKGNGNEDKMISDMIEESPETEH